jgi:hypothetical protein
MLHARRHQHDDDDDDKIQQTKLQYTRFLFHKTLLFVNNNNI